MQIYSKIPTVGAVQNVSSKNLLSLFLSVSSNASFEKCNFYPNNFKFCGVKKSYKYLQRYWTEIWKCYS